MRILLGVFMVLIVSGDDETITGVLDDSVLLPCTCPERNLDKEFKWQMEEPNMMLVLKHNSPASVFYGRYRGRARVLLDESSRNCSLLLTNITADDVGKYRCVFYSQGKYKKFFVNLNISASYNVCQKPSANNPNGDLSVKGFQCDAEGRYGEAELQWNLDGQLLTNSPTTHITHSKTLNASTGLYHLTSRLVTQLNGTSEPKCDVKAKDVSTIISNDCGAESRERFLKNPVIHQPEDFFRSRYLIIIPIMMVLGVTLLLRCRWESSWSLPKRKEVKTGNI
ncbi:butyrophilin subfamily 3 member A2-like isoform X2 [Chelmon rostratus]|uniref:butyrophilin subfamily 3 member A2-like isoform X2 n=1 Tax=Chelmon rostratus TaxID=109905 RepID=UPI001BE5E1B7|nr:butyrophilin subfamily 3 member A2-like isoform X2 [Chelmon rostratus]